MKKAKEYSEYILSFKDDEDAFINAISKSVQDIVVEIKELAETRNIQTRSALKAIILEQDRKWKSVCNKIEKPSMRSVFMSYMRHQFPEVLEEAEIKEE